MSDEGAPQALLGIDPELAQRLAHEIRSPLGVVMGALDQSLRDPDASPKSAQFLELARRSCVRMQRLARRLDTLAPTSGPTSSAARLGDSVPSWVERVEREARRSKITVDLSIDPQAASTRIAGDLYSTLEIAIDELLHNAVQHAKAKVTIAVARKHGGLEVRIQDDGSGAPAEVIAKHPARQTTSRGGLGLGLKLASDRLQSTGGRLDVEALKHGLACFEVPVS